MSLHMQATCPALRQVPEIIWFQIFKYFAISEFVKLRLVSKKFKEYIKHYLAIYERECLRIFTSDLQLFADKEETLEETKEPPKLSKTVSTMQAKWMKLMKKGGCLKRLWVPTPQKGYTESLPFDIWFTLREYLLETLKDPPMPLPELAREEYNAYRNTLLQFHLYEFIFQEADVELGMEKSPETLFADQLERLEELAPTLIEECQNPGNRELFFDLRWYSTLKFKKRLNNKGSHEYPTMETMCSTIYKSSPSIFDLQLLKEVSEFKSTCKPSLVRLVYAILETLKYYCKVCKNYILKDRSPTEAVNEYCKRWNGYCAAMIELDKNLYKVSRLVNKCYETLYPHFPKYPQFSFTRAMITMWKTFVFNKLGHHLMEWFKGTLEEVRHKKLMELLVKINGKKMKSMMTMEVDEEEESECQKESLLSRVVQAVADLSINDLRVHFLGSTKFFSNGPYTDLHNSILSSTKKYYKEVAVNSLPILTFKSFVDSYRLMMGQIVLPVTLKGIEQLSQLYLEKYCRHYVRKRFEAFAANPPASGILPGTASESHLRKYLQELSSEHPSSTELAQAFYQEFLEVEPSVASLYESTFISREEVESERDLEIDFMNQKRGIPYMLSKEEDLLYDYGKEITLEMLEEIFKKFVGDSSQDMAIEEDYDVADLQLSMNK